MMEVEEVAEAYGNAILAALKTVAQSGTMPIGPYLQMVLSLQAELDDLCRSEPTQRTASLLAIALGALAREAHQQQTAADQERAQRVEALFRGAPDPPE